MRRAAIWQLNLDTLGQVMRLPEGHRLEVCGATGDGEPRTLDLVVVGPLLPLVGADADPRRVELVYQRTLGVDVYRFSHFSFDL